MAFTVACFASIIILKPQKNQSRAILQKNRDDSGYLSSWQNFMTVKNDLHRRKGYKENENQSKFRLSQGEENMKRFFWVQNLGILIFANVQKYGSTKALPYEELSVLSIEK